MAPTHTPRLALTLLALGAPLALAAGCGGGSDQPDVLTKAQVIQRGSAICKAAERQVAHLPSPTAEHPFTKGTSRAEREQARRFLAGTADALESSRVGLKGLAAPA